MEIDRRKAEASAFIFKHQVIPFLKSFLSNIDRTIRGPELAGKSEDALTDRSNKTKAFDGFVRRVFSRIVLSVPRPMLTML
jgi:hypothetical protein